LGNVDAILVIDDESHSDAKMVIAQPAVPMDHFRVEHYTAL
jgi:hypothetical protein